MRAKLLSSLLPLALVFTMVSCSPDATEDSNVDATLVENYDYNATEVEMARLINQHRTSIGLNELEKVNHISFKSEEHNEYMIANQVVNHDYFFERSQNIRAVLGAVRVNENIAYNFPTPANALAAWLNSEGHRENIEGDFTHFGISVTEDPATGKKYYTNIFIKK